jgi:hypothetical protein
VIDLLDDGASSRLKEKSSEFFAVNDTNLHNSGEHYEMDVTRRFPTRKRHIPRSDEEEARLEATMLKEQTTQWVWLPFSYLIDDF